MPIASLMEPGSDGFATVMEPPHRQGHGALVARRGGCADSRHDAPCALRGFRARRALTPAACTRRTVPTRYIGKKLRARIDKKTVRLYLHGVLVKVHSRVAPGKRSTDLSDYPVGKAPYASRSVDSLITRSKSLGEHVGLYAERLLAGPLPWIKMRQGYGLIRLCERYGAERVDALCKRSLAFDVVDVPRIERMLKQAQTAEDTAPAGRIVPLPTSRFARDPASFATRAPSSPKGR